MILMGLASSSYGFGGLPLGTSGWNWIGGVTVGGAVLLGCIPELLFGEVSATLLRRAAMPPGEKCSRRPLQRALPA